MGLRNDDLEWDFEQAEYRAISAYKTLQEKDSTSDLLKFVNITTKGWWIFKKTEIEISREHEKEYLIRYSPGNKRYPPSLDSYASDLENALRKK